MNIKHPKILYKYLKYIKKKHKKKRAKLLCQEIDFTEELYKAVFLLGVPNLSIQNLRLSKRKWYSFMDGNNCHTYQEVLIKLFVAQWNKVSPEALASKVDIYWKE